MFFQHATENIPAWETESLCQKSQNFLTNMYLASASDGVKLLEGIKKRENINKDKESILNECL